MMRVVFTKYRQFLNFFIVFEWGRIFESAMDKQEMKCNAKFENVISGIKFNYKQYNKKLEHSDKKSIRW